MVRRVGLFCLLAMMLFALPVGVFSDDYESLLREKARSVVPVKFTVKMTVTRGGESNTREISAAANGVLVNEKGLLLMSARQLKGPAMFQRGNRPNISLETVTRDIKARMPDGDWVGATLAARDSGLDLAFVKVEKSVSDYDELRPVTFSGRSDSPSVGEEIIHVSRFREEMNYEPHFLLTRINALVEAPRLRFGLMDGAGMLASYIGSPGFDSSGEFLGMATFRSGGASAGGPGASANPYANMSKNQQFLLPAETIKTAVEDFDAR